MAYLQEAEASVTRRVSEGPSFSHYSGDQAKLAELVQLKHFGGPTLAECAEVLGVSPRTADSWWSYARAWLVIALKEE